MSELVTLSRKFARKIVLDGRLDITSFTHVDGLLVDTVDSFQLFIDLI